jgi:signal transduction histidine kinase
MSADVTRLSWVQRVTIAVLGAGAATVLGVEGLSAETVPTAVGVVICGMVALAALFLPALVVLAPCASVVFSVVCTRLAVRPDNTFGVVELVALSWLIVRVIMVQPARRAVWVVPLLYVAVAVLPLRLDAGAEPYRDLMLAATLLGAAIMVLLGMYLRLYERRRADGYELARQNQRLEYARDLHDLVAHHVTAIVAQTKALRYTAAAGQPPSPEALDSVLDGIERVGSQALASMRGMVTVLRGDEPPPRQRTIEEVVSSVVHHFPGPPPVATTIDDDLTTRHLPRQTLDAVEHVVQESLTNVLRHATDVRQVDVSVCLRDGELEINVTNDGRDAVPALSSGGFGLIGLTERVKDAGGRLSAGPATPGWRVTATLPSSTA